MEMHVKQNTTENRELWTNQQWADYMGVKKWRITQFRKFINDNFVYTIVQDENNGKWYFVLNRCVGKQVARVPYVPSDRGFENPEKCIEDAKTRIIPSLQVNQFISDIFDVPQNVLQMLKIGNKGEKSR